jgi:hypothetical protein
LHRKQCYSISFNSFLLSIYIKFLVFNLNDIFKNFAVSFIYITSYYYDVKYNKFKVSRCYDICSYVFYNNSSYSVSNDCKSNFDIFWGCIKSYYIWLNHNIFLSIWVLRKHTVLVACRAFLYQVYGII